MALFPASANSAGACVPSRSATNAGYLGEARLNLWISILGSDLAPNAGVLGVVFDGFELSRQMTAAVFMAKGALSFGVPIRNAGQWFVATFQ